MVLVGIGDKMDKEICKKILISAKELLINGWCQGNPAIDSNGNACHHLGPNGYEGAVSFCILGAIDKSSKDLLSKEQYSEFRSFPNFIDDATGSTIVNITGMNQDIDYWQDEEYRTKEEILAFMDKAIELCDREIK